MKKRILFVFIVWLLFLIPFLILSSHLINSIHNLAMSSSLYRIDIINSSLASYAASILENEYNIFFSFDKKTPSAQEIIRFLSLKKGNILQGFSLYNENGKRIHSVDFSNSDEYKSIIENIKKMELPAGIVQYPDNKPADLIIGKKVGSFYVLYKTDLGYLISKVIQRISKAPGTFYLVDGDFNVIYDSLDRYLLSREMLPEEIVNLIREMIKQSNFSYRGMIRIGGSDFLLSIYNIENTKWWSIAALDTSEVKDEELSSWARRVIITGVVLIFLFSWVVVFISKRFF